MLHYLTSVASFTSKPFFVQEIKSCSGSVRVFTIVIFCYSLQPNLCIFTAEVEMGIRFP